MENEKRQTDEKRVLEAMKKVFKPDAIRKVYETAKPPYWNGKTPKDLVEEGRVDEVLSWIGAIAEGIFW